MDFTWESRSPRVIFGAGRLAELVSELDRIESRRALLVGSLGRSPLLVSLREKLGERAPAHFAGAGTHVPEGVALAALRAAKAAGADCLIAVGGGSAIGTAKAVAVSTGFPIVAVPTTYSGSEMTSIWGTTGEGEKTTGRDAKALPRTVIYDPDLMLELPVNVSVASGLNAIAHCTEALYAVDSNPLTSLVAEQGIRVLATALRAIVANPGNSEARAQALYGACLAGHALASVQMALHHKLCHTLGGSFGLPHADTHAVLLPYTTAYNAAAAPKAMQRIARALSASDAPAALDELRRELGAPTTLAQLGMREEDLDVAAELALKAPYPNPAPVTREGVRALLEDAWSGELTGA